MAAIAPNTTIYLIKAPIEADQLNIIKFATETAQLNYFLSLPKLTLTNATYQRDDGVIRFEAEAEDIRDYNYCIYQNTAYGNKWIYAFITNIEYYSNNSCGISIQTDYWNTWQHQITFQRSFVEREHVNDDGFGKNTIPEGLEYGDYVCNEVQQATYADPSVANSLMIAFQVTTCDVSPNNGTGVDVFPSSTYGMHNGIPQGCQMFGLPYTENASASISTIVGYYDAAGKGDAIVSIFLIPRACSGWTLVNDDHGVAGRPAAMDNLYVPDDSTSESSLLGPVVTRNTTIDGYTPHNAKLFCAPYNMLYLSNNAGADCVYQWELFGGNPTFAVEGALEQGGSIKIYPQNSKKSAPSIGDGWNEGLTGGKLPVLSWKSDFYLNWQAVNATNVEIQAGLAAAGWGVSMLSGMVGGAVGSNPVMKDGAVQGGASGSALVGAGGGMLGSTLGLADQVRGLAQQVRTAEMIPPTAKGNINAGSLQFSSGRCQFTFRKMSIKAEYARIIDAYFDAYGYKVNAFKIPNITGRANWNYVRTVGCNITGNVPQVAIEGIKAIFNTGTTVWHNTSTFMDYSQSNAIVS